MVDRFRKELLARLLGREKSWRLLTQEELRFRELKSGSQNQDSGCLGEKIQDNSEKPQDSLRKVPGRMKKRLSNDSGELRKTQENLGRLRRTKESFKTELLAISSFRKASG